MIGLLTTFSCCSSSPASALAFTSATKIVLLAFSSRFFFWPFGYLEILDHAPQHRHDRIAETKDTPQLQGRSMGAQWVHSGSCTLHSRCTMCV